MDSIAIIYHK